MTNNPYNRVIISTIKMSSLTGNPGGDGGFLNPGEGGFGPANTIAIPKRHIIAIKTFLAVVFILIL